MDDVFITGLGLVSPLGIGCDATWEAIHAKQSGVRTIADYATAGWIAPYGGVVTDFNPKQYIKPRKSLKVMAREIQFAFAAAEFARESAGLSLEADLAEGNPGAVSSNPDRTGVVLGAGTMYCDIDELVDAYQECANDQGFDFSKWGDEAIRKFFPLWMLKYLPNMSACHIGIRQDARGPNNTVAHGDVSSLLALAEATKAIQRGQADLMFVGGVSSRLTITDLLWHGGARLAQSDAPPESLCRPFDASRQGMVVGEGSAMFVLESARHARRRGVEPIARIAATASRTESTIEQRRPPGKAIAGALGAALQTAGLSPSDLGHINAHGAGTLEGDPIEAAAIAEVLAGADVPVTAPKSYFGNLGAGSGAVELAVSLLALQHGIIPATLNHQQTDPACPIRVAADHEPTTQPSFATLNHTSTGQAVAAIVTMEK